LEKQSKNSAPQELSLRDFSYPLPDELIAQAPLRQRDDSRLLCYQKNKVHDLKFKELPDILPTKSLLVFNNTKVLPSRLFGRLETGGKAEIFLLNKRPGATNLWKCIGKPMRKFKVGTRILLESHLVATIRDLHPSEDDLPTFLVEFSLHEDAFLTWLDHHGIIPLPPYIKRSLDDKAQMLEDKIRYQTVYSKISGSVAAPTAGLHFTSEIFEKLSEAGISRAEVTLNVGAGTFLPVKQQNISDHQMHAESYTIHKDEWQKIQDHRSKKLPIIAVGTTSFRCVESFAHLTDLNSEKISTALDRSHETELFIFPKTKQFKYKSNIFSGLMTNFHQPESTLFMLICTLVGYEEAFNIYTHAIKKRYRFLSYGDSSYLEFSS